jgi:hypothetical protein
MSKRLMILGAGVDRITGADSPLVEDPSRFSLACRTGRA